MSTAGVKQNRMLMNKGISIYVSCDEEDNLNSNGFYDYRNSGSPETNNNNNNNNYQPSTKMIHEEEENTSPRTSLANKIPQSMLTQDPPFDVGFIYKGYPTGAIAVLIREFMQLSEHSSEPMRLWHGMHTIPIERILVNVYCSSIAVVILDSSSFESDNGAEEISMLSRKIITAINSPNTQQIFVLIQQGCDFAVLTQNTVPDLRKPLADIQHDVLADGVATAHRLYRMIEGSFAEAY